MRQFGYLLLLVPIAAFAAPAESPLTALDAVLEQTVELDLNADGKPDYVALIKSQKMRTDPNYVKMGWTDYDLQVYVGEPQGYRLAKVVPSFWNAWGSAGNDSLKPTLQLDTDTAAKQLLVNIKDNSDEGADQRLRFRWENDDLRLIGSTKHASPQVTMKAKGGMSLQGRVSRSSDTNWLTGKQVVNCELHAKPIVLQRKLPYTTIQQADLASDDLKRECTASAR